MIANLLALALAATVSSDPGASFMAGVEFDRRELREWTILDEREVTPYHREGMRSKLLLGARSPRGSYAFVTVIDNTVERPARDADEIARFILPDTYAHLDPRDMETGFVAVLVGGQSLRATTVSFSTSRLSYEAGAAGEPALVKVVLLPVVLRERGSGVYHNLIVAADFRGASADLPAFERMQQRLLLDESGLAVIDLAKFNALRDQLQASGALAPAGSGEAASAAPPDPGDEARSGLEESLAGLARGKASPADRLRLERYAREDATTPLAEWIQRALRRARVRFEAGVWRSLAAAGRGEHLDGLAARLLHEGIVLGDLETALAIAAGARAAGLSAVELDCGDLELLTGAVLDHRDSAPLAHPEVRVFFALDSALRCPALPQFLARRGVSVSDLEDVASRDEAGRWRARKGRDVRPLLWHERRLIRAVPSGRSLAFVPVPNLLDVAEQIEATDP